MNFPNASGILLKLPKGLCIWGGGGRGGFANRVLISLEVVSLSFDGSFVLFEP